MQAPETETCHSKIIGLLEIFTIKRVCSLLDLGYENLKTTNVKIMDLAQVHQM